MFDGDWLALVIDLGIGIDPIDVDILREMYRDQKVTVAGIDPRLNVSRIARRLRTSRARIASRLRRWGEAGFVRRYDVWPNPALFGLRGWSCELRSTRRLEKPELFRRIALLDGVVGGQEFLGDWSAIQLVAPDESTCRRRLALLRGLEGVAEVGEPLPWSTVEPKRALSLLDLRILRALRRSPRGSLTEIARTVGISTRTMTARYGTLLDEWAVWFVPLFDFAKIPLPVVSLNVQLTPGASHGVVVSALRKEFPWSLEFGWAGMRPLVSPDLLVFFVTLPSAAVIEDLERFATRLAGVQAVELSVMVRTYSFTDWFDSLLAPGEAVATGTPRIQLGIAEQHARPGKPRRPTRSYRSGMVEAVSALPAPG